jgi:hypothetical protein
MVTYIKQLDLASSCRRHFLFKSQSIVCLDHGFKLHGMHLAAIHTSIDWVVVGSKRYRQQRSSSRQLLLQAEWQFFDSEAWKVSHIEIE